MTSSSLGVALLLLLVGQTLARSGPAPRVRPGVWLWNCDGAAYMGDHPHGFYTHMCKRDVFEAPPDALRGALQVFPWSQVEPKDGVFDWTGVDANLTAMAKAGVQVSPTIWICKGATISGAVPLPKWMQKVSPGIPYQHEAGKDPVLLAPNYLDPVFQGRFKRLIQAFASHLSQLPDDVRNNVWAVEAALGITGDSRPWKGVPVHASQQISQATWIKYNQKFTRVYVDAFVPTGIPVIANVENPNYDNGTGLLQSKIYLDMAAARGMANAAVKQGSVSHGYNLNGELDIYRAVGKPLMLTPRSDGTYARSRGELALEPDPGLPGSYGNWKISPSWSLQANAEWVLTYGLDAWNLYAGWLANASFAETLRFYNRHAGHKDVRKTPAAFISFRDSLNTENVKRWPIAKYGPIDDSRNPDRSANAKRMSAIAKDFAPFGAQLADPQEASDKRSVIQKKGNHLSDVCWRCWPTNYGRYLTQLNPLQNSVGWWQQGPLDQAYGRFARGLHHATGREQITVVAEKGLNLHNATVSVVYLDRGGRWSLSLGSGTNRKVVLNVNVTGTPTGRWQTVKAMVENVRGGWEFRLWSPDKTDIVFSLLEVYTQDAA